MRLTGSGLAVLGVFLLAAVLARGEDPYAVGLVLAVAVLLPALVVLLVSLAGRRRPRPQWRWLLAALVVAVALGTVLGRHGRREADCPVLVGSTPYAEVDGDCVPVPAVTPAG